MFAKKCLFDLILSVINSEFFGTVQNLKWEKLNTRSSIKKSRLSFRAIWILDSNWNSSFDFYGCSNRRCFSLCKAPGSAPILSHIWKSSLQFDYQSKKRKSKRKRQPNCLLFLWKKLPSKKLSLDITWHSVETIRIASWGFLAESFYCSTVTVLHFV